MKEITIRAKSVVKLSDGKYNADWTFNAGTPVLSVVKSISTDYEQLQHQNDELVAKLSEINKCCEIAKNTAGWDDININLHFALDDLFHAANLRQQSTNGSDGDE